MNYLVIDSPPGTGDEPLTVAQTISDAKALIVTTPQEISLADVRKSINFCRQVKMVDEIVKLTELTTRSMRDNEIRSPQPN